VKLNQPAESDSEVSRLGNANKKKLTLEPAKNKVKFISPEVESNSVSLRDGWEKTLAQREQPGEPSEGVYKFNETKEKEIHLHVDADEIHDGVQLDNKSDPSWEPWQAKKPETAIPPGNIVPVANQPVVEKQPAVTVEEPDHPTSLDPALASETLLHSRAVADIARQHAEMATPPSYKDQLPKEAQEIMERLQPAKNHHLEQSTWHNIEVDNKTGRAAEEPTFSYGEAFKDEQRTETNAFHTDTAVATASGQLAVSSPIFNNLNDNDAAILNSPRPAPNPPVSPRGQMDFDRPGGTSIDPLLWTILVVIIFAIFLALII
jgi:hypothetical protein